MEVASHCWGIWKHGRILTPVIVMSAYDQLSDQMTAMGIGAVDYLVKPFGLAEMTARIRKAARLRRLIRLRNAG